MNWVIIGSGNGLAPGMSQTITWPIADVSFILLRIETFISKIMYTKIYLMSSIFCRHQCVKQIMVNVGGSVEMMGLYCPR